jgi:hypothetical protein
MPESSAKDCGPSCPRLCDGAARVPSFVIAKAAVLLIRKYNLAGSLALQAVSFAFHGDNRRYPRALTRERVSSIATGFP